MAKFISTPPGEHSHLPRPWESFWFRYLRLALVCIKISCCFCSLLTDVILPSSFSGLRALRLSFCVTPFALFCFVISCCASSSLYICSALLLVRVGGGLAMITTWVSLRYVWVLSSNTNFEETNWIQGVPPEPALPNAPYWPFQLRCRLRRWGVFFYLEYSPNDICLITLPASNCGFSSNWILHYFPLSVRVSVTGVTSHISHIYKGINAMLIIRGPIKPYISWIKIIPAIFLAKTRPSSPHWPT